MTCWKVSLLTIFPEMFPGPLAHSIAGKAMAKKLFNLQIKNIRDFTLDQHKTVDDRPFGGGAGMVMKPDILGRAIDQVLAEESASKLIYFSPRGQQFTQAIAHELISHDHILMLCGRYEGVDQRVLKKYNFSEYSIGDYILSGGEIAALTVLDTCLRLLPGVIDNLEANLEESFSGEQYKYLLEYDQYTRPLIWQEMQVPEILLSGHHKEIAKWRLENAKSHTKQRRPDLWKKYTDI